MSTESTNGVLEDFRVEFEDCWRRLPDKGLFFVLLAAWLALFHFLGNATIGMVPTTSLLHWMWSVYQPGPLADQYDDTHALIVPFVVLALFWRKRNQLLALNLRPWPPALGLVALGLVLHILGYAVQQPRISIAALFVGIYGLMGLAWGREWLRLSFFPFVLFVFCEPLGTLALPITFPLRLMVGRIVEAICHFPLSIDVGRDGTALFDPSHHYQYEIAAACSGMRSLVACLGLSVVYGMLSFRAWWRRGLIVASAIPLAVIGNVLRLLLIIIAAEIGGQKYGNYVHEGGPGGILSLLPYVACFGGLLLVGHLLREKPQAPVRVEEPSTEPAKSATV
jgi:exosortase